MWRVDVCFKGERPANELVPVLFDNILPPGGGPYVVLQKRNYRLLFHKPEKANYVLSDDWFGQLRLSRRLGYPSAGDSDPLNRLEADLKAGLSDPDRERVLDSIRMLGNMRHLQSKAELIALLDSPDLLVRTTVLGSDVAAPRLLRLAQC